MHVEQIVSDGKLYEPRAGLHLPPLQRDLKIDYTGLSFTVPEQVQFRYRLEGRDAEWQDAGTRREAFYTDLSPGHYRFRVIAANNSGVWNDQGDTLEFSIAPAWWQADAFRAGVRRCDRCSRCTRSIGCAWRVSRVSSTCRSTRA